MSGARARVQTLLPSGDARVELVRVTELVAFVDEAAATIAILVMTGVSNLAADVGRNRGRRGACGRPSTRSQRREDEDTLEPGSEHESVSHYRVRKSSARTP